MRGYQGYVADMLNDDAQDIRVLIYAGDADFICNWIGNKAWAVDLEWAHGAEFAAAPDEEWTVDGAVAGKRRTVSGFSFVQVYDAGHMVPLDQPENALAMANAFMRNKL